MNKRHLVQIPADMVSKLSQLEPIRKDLAGYTTAKKVHLLLQEKISEILQGQEIVHDKESGNWFVYIRDAIPLHTLSSIAIGVVRNSAEMIGCRFTKILATNDSTRTWWGNYREDIKNVSEFLLDNLNKKEFALNYFRKYDQVIELNRNACHTLISLDLSKLEKEQLLKSYTENFERIKRFHALSFDIDSMDIGLEERMKKKLGELMSRKYGKYSSTLFNAKYTLLTTPKELLYINHEQIELLELALKISCDKEALKIFSSDVDTVLSSLQKENSWIIAEIEKIQKKYWWMTLGWSDQTVKNLAMYIQELKKSIKDAKSAKDKLMKLKSLKQDTIKQKSQLSNELGFDREMDFYLEIFDKYMAYHDLRKEIQMKSTFLLNKFLFELSRRYSYRYNDLAWCWPWEIEEHIISGKLNTDLTEQRRESFFMLVTEKDIQEYSGDEAIQKRKLEISTTVKGLHDFHGTVASPGKVIGAVKVCFSASEAAAKIQQGDILVTSMTMPEYLPAMKKSAGIITDEGGVTSHAAIVSRELKLPCIVATKIATSLLKDGDVVELNANHGRVTILNGKE